MTCRSGFEKGSAAAEQLSALADGELDAAAAGAACAAWKTDAELRANLARLAPDRRRAAFRGPGVGRRARSALPPSPCAGDSRSSRWCWRPRRGRRGGAPGASRRRWLGLAAAQRPLPPARWLLPPAVAAGFTLVVGTFVVLGPTGAPAPAPTLAGVAPPAVESPIVQASVARARGAGSSAVARQRQDDPRPAPRALSGRAQAVRRHLGARRAVHLPAQRHGRRRAALRRRARSPPACRRRALVPLALACAAIAGRAGSAGAVPIRCGVVAAAERDARLAAAHPRRRQPAQLPGNVRGERRAAVSPARGFRTSAKGANQYERIESLDGRQRKVFRHNDVVHTVWPASKVAMIEQRGQLSSFPALLQASDDAPGRVVRDAGSRAAIASPATKPTCSRSSRATSYRYGYRLWADRASGCCCASTSIGERGDDPRDRGFLRRRRSACAPQPDSVVQAMKKLDGYRDRQAGADADPPRGRRLDDALRSRPASGSGELRQPADRSARRGRRRPDRRRRRLRSRPSTPTA